MCVFTFNYALFPELSHWLRTLKKRNISAPVLIAWDENRCFFLRLCPILRHDTLNGADMKQDKRFDELCSRMLDVGREYKNDFDGLCREVGVDSCQMDNLMYAIFGMEGKEIMDIFLLL